MSFSLLCLHCYDLLCSPTASPGTAWVPQQCFHSDSLQEPGAVSRVAVVWHLQQCPRESAMVRKHLYMFPFWLWLVAGTQAHWQLVKPGKAPASLTPAHIPFPTFQSRCFPIGEVGLEWPRRKVWDASGCLHPERPCSASCDVPNPNLNLSSPKGAGHEDNMCVMQPVQVPCSPRASDWCFAPAQTLHRVSLGPGEWWSSFLLPSI